MSNDTLASPARQRQVCPHCGSADLVEIAFGHREFAVTYYVDGGWDDRSGGEWDVETWLNRCDACDSDLAFDELIPEDES